MAATPSLSNIARAFYQQNPHLWMRDRLGIPLHTIQWSTHPAYRQPAAWPEIDAYRSGPRVRGDGTLVTENWDGTPDPLFAGMKGLVDWKDVGMEAGTGTQKTFTAAAIVLWFLDVWGYEDPDPVTNDFVGCFVLTLAPKEDQLKLNLWKEIARLWPKFQKLHPQAELMRGLEIRMRPNREDWKAFGYPVGVAAGEEVATRARGFHAPHMLIIFEEAPGIPLPVFEAIENTCTSPHNLRLALGNPEHVTDSLHQFCLLPSTVHIQISALDHPNCVADDYTIVNGAVSRTSVEKRLAKYKRPTHPLFQSSVRGQCPDTSDASLFDADAIALARKYLREPIETVVHSGASEGETRIYFKAAGTHLNRYILFGDVAGDGGKGDWHACVVFDRLKRRPAAIIHMRGPREDYVGEILRVANLYRVWWPGQERWFLPLVAWEKTGAGALILDHRLKVYPNLYHGRSLEIPDPNVRANVGWDTTSRTRKSIVDELQEWGLELYTHPYRMVDPALLSECSSFIWVTSGSSGRYEAAPGCHDDVVLAMGGALVIDKLIPPATFIAPAEEKKEEDRLPSPPPDKWSRPIPSVF